MFVATLLVVAAFSTIACYWLVRLDRLVLRLLVAVGGGLVSASIVAGVLFWEKIGLGGRLMMLSAQIALSILLLRAGRNAWDVVIASRERPPALGQRLALAAGGSLVAAALAGALATGRGLELSLLARPHWFYVLVVPAVAGFGLTTTGNSGPSKLFSTLTVTVVLLIIFYCFGILYFGAPEILCDMHIYNPHYEVLGFDWEPWHWKQREGWRWIFAPGALTELSILHVFDPVPNLNAANGAYCAD